ncbi:MULTISPECIES: hypothetical protein [Flavobacterium]|uniref:hypothetical protein n=1 Tax=Flavobacterium TaxID=237 RepID=UPI001FCA905F|nr:MULTISPECIES: hypothetical protein [Flavobacterium]UOK41425.1 hypothetical protein LZF87_08840 [Flavobacterium enshiense]
MDDFFNRLPDNPSVNFTESDYLEAKRDEQKLDNDIKKASVKRYERDTELRGSLAVIFTIIISAWLVSVILILMNNHYQFKLSDTVLVTLLTTTTVQVLGMMLIILWDLFPGGKDKNNHNEK